MIQLPEIKITRHARAKNMRVRVYLHKIEVCVPVHCSKLQMDHFIDQSMDWILETWHKKSQQADSKMHIPTHLHLFNCDYPLELKVIEQKKAFIFCENDHMVYLSQNETVKALVQFILAYAKQHLLLYLQHVSHDVNIMYAHSQARFAKSRWGSCNSNQKIMLNAALIFLPMPVVRYVCIHELAHIEHLNHSAKFWKKVKHLDSNYLINEQYLKNFQLPHWLLTQLKYI